MTTTEPMADLVDKFETGMLITHKLRGAVVAEPLSIAGWADGALYLLTAPDSIVNDRIVCDNRVGVTLQGPKCCVSLSGTAEVVVEEERLRALGGVLGRLRSYGRRHGDYSMIRVQPTEMEMWETSPWKTLNQARDVLKAWFTGQTQDEGALLGHARLTLASRS